MIVIPTKYSFDNYSVVNTNGLIILHYQETISGYSKQNIWSKCMLRKPMKCVITGETMPKGTIVYRPTTNGCNRNHRMKATELEKYLK